MNYLETIEYLNDISRLGSKPGLDNIKELLKRLGNPEKSLNVIHVAGTNGKGSVIAFLNSILTEAGYRVGCYTSPAVFDRREIVRIDNEFISEKDMSLLITKIQKVCCEMVKDGLSHPTVFEVETAMAILYFYESECNICLIECGMGGDMDATNVFEHVLCSIITTISIDHTSFLGSSLEEIAKRKAGIIKKNCPVVVSIQEECVKNTIIQRAGELHSEVYFAGVAEYVIENNPTEYQTTNADSNQFRLSEYQKKNEDSNQFRLSEYQEKKDDSNQFRLSEYQKKNADSNQSQSSEYQTKNEDSNVHIVCLTKNICYRSLNGSTYSFKMHMCGSYQLKNAAVAIETVEILEQSGYRVKDFICEGIKKAVWPGRMEIVSENPFIIIDGAHNPGAVRELKSTIDFYFTNKKIDFIMGVLADKDFDEEANIIANRAESVYTITPHHERALSGEQLAKTIAKYNRNVRYCDTIEDALKTAIKDVAEKKADLIIAFGSLSFLSEVKKVLKQE